MRFASVLILLSLLLPVSSVLAVTKSRNLAGGWRLEETSGTSSADLSGNANTGTLTGSPSRVAGKLGTGLSLNGSSQYVTIPSSASLRISGQITVSAWVKLSSIPSSNWANIVSKGFDGGTVGYDLRLTYFGSSTLDILSYDGSEYGTSYDVSAWTTGVWYHVVGLYDGTNWKLYVNGVNVSTTASGTGALGSANTGPLVIGGFDNSGSVSRLFPGTIDEVRVYNRGLTAAEVRSLMLGFEPGEF